MNKLHTFLFCFLLFPVLAFSQEKRGLEDTLTHHLQPWEAKLKHLNGKDFVATPPPVGPVRNVAEFDRMQGVLIRYPFGIPMAVIKEMAEDVMVTTIVTGTSQENTVRGQYTSNGVNLSNCNFLHAPTNSYWTRDYGPWYVFDGNGDPGIVDFPYNRPRPYDDEIPVKMAAFLGIDLYGMDIEHTGGNYMTDGMGISSSTDLVWTENPSLTHAQIDQMVLNYLGINTYHVVPDPNNTYIDHIDCWGKFLDTDKILIREVPPSHSQYDEIEATAAFYASQTTSYGTNFEVYRVYTPNNEPYTNSLILNNKVLVPLKGTSWDDEAIQSYEEAMPGYEVIGFVYSGWDPTDALHCRTKGVADIGMLHIRHLPIHGNAPVLPQYQIDAEVTAHSGQTVYNDSVFVFYSLNDGPFTALNMTHVAGNDYIAYIPGQPEGSKIAYYLYAADASGRSETHPFIGAADPHIFFSGQPLFPDISVMPAEVNATCATGGSVPESLTLYNNGQFLLNYQISCNVSVTEDFNYTVSNSPSKYAYDYNTYTELNWTGQPVSQSGVIAGWGISYTWSTDNYAYEGSFYVKSPSGTTAMIASGNANGTYTVSLNHFNGQEMNGIWQIWIQDSYGDGGHQATGITMTITREVPVSSWLSVNPATGTVNPSDNEGVTVICDASGLSEGMFEGTLTIASNDPDTPEINVPV
ncbi:MAG: agmatine deiminase family protein, partial [Bacteroidales bacterium]|nr:agmatine deiminase family protein [Bacteroidales bacterium]